MKTTGISLTDCEGDCQLVMWVDLEGVMRDKLVVISVSCVVLKYVYNKNRSIGDKWSINIQVFDKKGWRI